MITSVNTRRRAFSLLEVVMAASIGGVIVLVCLGIFSAMDRSDTLLAARAEQSGDLQRTRLVMQRTFMKIVTSDTPRPTPDDPNNPGRRRPRDAASPDAPPPPPRVILEASASAPQAPMTTSRGTTMTPQRLEVVLLESPVPTETPDLVADLLAGRPIGRRRSSEVEKPSMFDKGAAGSKSGSATGRSAGTSSSGMAAKKTSGLGATSLETARLGSGPGAAAAGADSRAAAAASAKDALLSGASAAGTGDSAESAADDEEATVRCLRGAFEVRPQVLTTRQRAILDRRGNAPDTVWELWWMPLPPKAPVGTDVPLAMLRRPLDEPTLIASNIRSMQWRMFDDRQKKTALAVTWQVELPAYAEVEIETTAGLKADWLFEVDSYQGAEVPRPHAGPGAAGAAHDTTRAVPVDGGQPQGGSLGGKGGGGKQ